MAARLRLAAFAVAGAALVAWPFVTGSVTWFYGVLTTIYTLIALSVTVLAGWTGQVSLCQAAFFGLGVYATQPLVTSGWPLPLVLVAVPAGVAAVSLALGAPSLRLRGVQLTVVTIAFGAACELWFFPKKAVSGASSAKLLERPEMFGLSLQSDRALYFLGLAVALFALWVMARLRRSDTGRVLYAIRDAEDAAASLGVRIAPYKIAAFALSAALAASGGVLYALLLRSTPFANQFGVLQSVFYLALPVVGGISSLLGAVIGGVFMATALPVVNALHLRLYTTAGVMLLVVVLARWGGVAGLLAGAWENTRRLVLEVRNPVRRRPVPAPVLRATVPATLPAGATARLRLRSGS